MKIKALPLMIREILNREDDLVPVAQIGFEITLEFEEEDDFFRKMYLEIDFDKDGNILNFPTIGATNCRNPRRHVEVGHAVQAILDFEGEQARPYCKKMFDIFDNLQIKKEKLFEDSNYREIKTEYNKICTEISEKTSAHARARKAEDKEAIMNDIELLYVTKDDINRNQLIPIENQERTLTKEAYSKFKEIKIIMQ